MGGGDPRNSNKENPVEGLDEGRTLGYVALIQKLTDLVIVISLACMSPCRCYLKESLVPLG